MNRFFKILLYTASCFFIIFNSYHANAEWRIETVEGDVDVVLYTSLALDSNNNPHIIYLDDTNRDLKYAYYNRSDWQIETVHRYVDPGRFSLAIDSLDRVHISSRFAYLKYTHNTTGSWISEEVDSDVYKSGFSTIAIDSSGNPHISYYDLINRDLKYAYYDGSWHTETVDGDGAVGWNNSLALDNNNIPHISYDDRDNRALKYAYYDGNNWSIEVVADFSGSGFIHSSLAIDTSNQPHISYLGGGHKYTTNKSGVWVTETVDSNGGYTSLALDSEGNAHISYPGDGLKYTTNKSGVWVTETVDSTGHLGASLALDSNNNAHISYIDTNRDLRYARQCSEPDSDCDYVLDHEDNCSNDYNPFQIDCDGDGEGDICDADTIDPDEDGVDVACDNCPYHVNPDTSDTDGDEIGDACDECTDTDGDGYGNPAFPNNTCEEDNCPTVSNPGQEDDDGDNIGNVCDNCPNDATNDIDEDTVCGAVDNCPSFPNPDQEDMDGDGVGDTCDNCPSTVNLNQDDTDEDGLGDACDNCPYHVNPDQSDTDGDGIGDTCDNCVAVSNPAQEDADNDGIGDICDNCPYHANPDQSDTDGDGIGDVCYNSPYVFSLLSAVGGSYSFGETCVNCCPWNCTDGDTYVIGNEIRVGDISIGEFPWWFNFSHYYGMMEFDISAINGLVTSGQIQATLFLTVKDGGVSSNECLSLYSMHDSDENGRITTADSDTSDFIAEVCADLQRGDTITFDVTSALENDLFAPNQTNFSGFVIKKSTGGEAFIRFYDHRYPENAPRLSISEIDADGDGIPLYSDNCPNDYNPDQNDMDGDCIGDACDPEPTTYNSTPDTDGDYVGDACDNCPYHYNPNQEDEFPLPNGNGIPDACDCESDFDCDGDVDGTDATTFKLYFGRNLLFYPCDEINPCRGDFECDQDCDGTDAGLFKSDFGRSGFSNPCPACVVDEWCVY